MIIFYQIRYSIAKVRRCLITMVLDRVAADRLHTQKNFQPEQRVTDVSRNARQPSFNPTLGPTLSRPEPLKPRVQS